MYNNPYERCWDDDGTWLKTNFHVHATPDGREARTFKRGRYTVTPKYVSEVVKSYKDAGYDALMIANQGFFLDTQEYAHKYDILMINGIEYIELDGILCIGINEYLTGSPQQVIDACNAKGGVTVLCHPNWMSEQGLPPKLSLQSMSELHGYAGIEILTAGVFTRFKGSGLATNVWDEFLTSGKLIWGFANDDFHTWFDIDRGWNVVHCQKRDLASIKKSIKEGQFYASTGLVLRQFSFQRDTIRIEANLEQTPDRRIHYEFVGEGGRILQDSFGESAEYHFKGVEHYVRVHASSSNGAMLWTQPVYDDDRLHHL